MASNYKQIALANDLAAALGLRKLGLAITQSFDTDKNPLIKVGTGSNGAAGCLIRIIPQDWPEAKDILGLTQNVFCPSVVEVALEANAAGGAGADINTWAVLLPVLGEAILRGARTKVYESSNGDSPDVDDMIDSKLKATFDPSAVYGMIANQ
jgi:hypothetical protein